jgi:hypothetical protein
LSAPLSASTPPGSHVYAQDANGVENNMDSAIPSGYAEIERFEGKAVASVWVEISRGAGFRVACDPSSSFQVEVLDGVIAPEGIQVACMSGARYARHLFPLAESTILIRGAVGRIAQCDFEAFSIATVVAIGRALGLESRIPGTAFQGVFGSWNARSEASQGHAE